MKCPDTNRLVDLARNELGDLEALAHLQSCSECRAEYEIVKQLPATLRPEISVSESLIARTLLIARGRGEAVRPRAWHLAASAALGASTVAGTLVVTGTSLEDVPRLAAFALAAAVGSAWYEAKKPPAPLRPA